MKATVLLFNFKDKERLDQIAKILLVIGVRVKKVNYEDYLQPVGYLSGVKEISPVEQLYDGEELADEMMFMAGMTSGQVDQLLLAMRKEGIARINCKAVLTETNQHWNAIQLFNELRKEYESFQQLKKQS